MYALNDHPHVLTQLLVAYVGLDPKRDIQWVTAPDTTPTDLFIDGKIDALLAGEPVQQDLRARKIGHTIFNNAVDRPWSQYFCCMVSARREFAQKYPVATKKALRAFLKAADICAQEPERVARYLAAKGYELRYEIGLEVLKSLPYARWRQSSPEDTLRFHALRLHEVGLIKSSPQKLIAQSADWRFLSELKKELKG